MKAERVSYVYDCKLKGRLILAMSILQYSDPIRTYVLPSHVFLTTFTIPSMGPSHGAGYSHNDNNLITSKHILPGKLVSYMVGFTAGQPLWYLFPPISLWDYECCQWVNLQPVPAWVFYSMYPRCMVSLVMVPYVLLLMGNQKEWQEFVLFERWVSGTSLINN